LGKKAATQIIARLLFNLKRKEWNYKNKSC
jgi:hypothetical protein